MLYELPNELLIHIFSFIYKPRDIVAFALTCKLMLSNAPATMLLFNTKHKITTEINSMKRLVTNFGYSVLLRTSYGKRKLIIYATHNDTSEIVIINRFCKYGDIIKGYGREFKYLYMLMHDQFIFKIPLGDELYNILDNENVTNYQN